MCLAFLFGTEGRTWDVIVSIPDHCLSIYFVITIYNENTCVNMVNVFQNGCMCVLKDIDIVDVTQFLDKNLTSFIR